MKEILQKYGTAIRYGDVGTRLFALSVPVCILAAVICVIIAFVANVMPLFLGGLLFGIGAFALHQRFDISEGVVEVDPKEPKAKKEKKSKEISAQAEPKADSKQAEPAVEEVAPETKPKKEKKKKEKKPKKEQAYEDAGYEEAPQDTANAGIEEEAADPMDVLDDPDLPKERPAVDLFDDDDDE